MPQYKLIENGKRTGEVRTIEPGDVKNAAVNRFWLGKEIVNATSLLLNNGERVVVEASMSQVMGKPIPKAKPRPITDVQPPASSEIREEIVGGPPPFPEPPPIDAEAAGVEHRTMRGPQ
jgi:hypothetical protein